MYCSTVKRKFPFVQHPYSVPYHQRIICSYMIHLPLPAVPAIVVDGDPDPEPTFYFDGNPDPTFHFEADPDPTFHCDADPIWLSVLIPIQPQVLHLLENLEFFLLLFTQQCLSISLSCLASVIIVIKYLESILKFSGKLEKVPYSLALHLVDMDPDRQAIIGRCSDIMMPIRPDPDPLHNVSDVHCSTPPAVFPSAQYDTGYVLLPPCNLCSVHPWRPTPPLYILLICLPSQAISTTLPLTPLIRPPAVRVCYASLRR